MSGATPGTLLSARQWCLCKFNSVPLRSASTADRLPPAKCSAALNAPRGLGHLTLAQAARVEVEVKKSRFIATAWPVTSAAQALQLIKSAFDPKATHNCYAYRLTEDVFRSSDDGEPGGTAGRPILAAIDGEGLEGVAVLVSRFYGGIKLGTGGLVRAYGSTARDCLRPVRKVFVKSRMRFMLDVPLETVGAVYNHMDKLGCERISEEYTESGGVQLLISVDAELGEALVTTVSNATNGLVVPLFAALPEVC